MPSRARLDSRCAGRNESAGMHNVAKSRLKLLATICIYRRQCPPAESMSTSPQSIASTVYAPEAILAHPRFAAARAAFVSAVLAAHEGDHFRSRLLAEAMRQVTFNLIVSLHLRFDPAERTTWPTSRRLKDELATFGLSSTRRIEALVSRFIDLGYVQSHPAEHDGRMRLLTPTTKMMALDREWLAYHYAPLHVMFPDSYSEPMALDPTFQRAQRLVALDYSAKGAQIMASNPAVMRFMGRDAGMLVLIKLVQMSIAADSAENLSYADIGARFGVSRTHVRSLLEDAAEHGYVRLTGRGGRLVELKPSIRQAFDRFLADSMSGHDLLYQLARERMAKAQRSASSVWRPDTQ
jgi:DNA-binding MarR family transcriptional regulator